MLQVIGRKFIDDQARELSFPFFSGYDRIKTVYTIDVEFSFDLSFSNAVVKDGNSLVLTSGSWEDFGFVVGADISGTYGANTIPGGTTITYIDGSLMMTDTALSGTDGDSFTSGSIVCDIAPDAFEFYFNLIPNSMSGGDASLIDNEVNRFKVYLDSLAIGSTANFTQQGLKSGGTSISATCKRIADTQYEITVNYNSWGVLLESEFTASKCLKPYIRIIAFPEYNNPTTSIQTVNTPSDANTGYYNEVGNGGVPTYTVASFDWTDGSFFYNQPSAFEAVINGNFDATSRFNICVYYDSNTESEYKNLPLSVHDNLMFLTTYPALGIGTSSGILSGQRADGSGLSLSIDIDTTSSTATITGTITPNSDFTAFMESVEESNRKFKFLIRVEDYTLIDNFINPVWLPVSIGTFEKFVEPLGVFEGEISLDLYDHAGENIREGGQLVTEDDLKIVGLYSLPKYNGFQTLSTEIVVKNSSTSDEFSLEKFTFNLMAFPLLTDGTKPIEQTYTRAFYLSPTNPNHIVRLSRRPDLDDEFTYGVQLEHSYLNNWKYWESQTNADISFYPDQDKNWIHYNDSPWAVNHLMTISTEVGDYQNYEPILINDYDQIDAEFTFTDLDGNAITKPYQNEKCIVICIHTSVDPFVDFNWAQMTIEPFEGSPRYDLSTVYNFDSVVQNPLNPLTGDTKLDYVVSTYSIKTQCIFDPSKMVDPSNVSFTSRISARIEKELIENRHKASFETAKKPKTFNSEDRGGKECCCSRTVIASQSSNDTYKNDITSNWQIGETVEFQLKTCEGIVTTWQPSTQSFPNDVNAKYCTIAWKDVLLAEGCGTYKLYATYTVAGISTTELKESFTLYEWVDGVESWDKLVNGTVRSKVVLNDANEYEGIDFTNANVVDTIRFEGDFNDFQPNMVVRNLQHRDNSIKKIKRENLTRWELKVYPETICTIDRILNVHLLAENTIYISDYNQYAYDKSILDKAYIVSEQGGGAKIENFGGSSKKGLTCELEPKVQKSKTHFGSVGSSAEPNPSLPPVPNTVEVGAEDANYHLKDTDGTELSSGTIPSGGTADITAPDGTVNIKKLADGTIHSQTVKSGSTVNYEVANNAITVNGGSGFDIKATDPLDIVLTDGTSSVTPTSVTYSQAQHKVDIVLPVAASIDSDAKAFLTAAAITDATITSAIDTFVTGLKSNGLWNKFYAIYPFVGGTASSHKWNLKDPRDLDAAYRLTFYGGLTHNANGITGNGLTGYADTYFNPVSVAINRENFGFTIYSRSSSWSGYAMGVTDGASFSLFLRSGTTQYYGVFDDGSAFGTLASGNKTLTTQRSSNTQQTLYRNGTSVLSLNTITTRSNVNATFTLFARNGAGGIQVFGNINTCMHAFHTVLTPTEVSTFNTLVVALQTTLSRNV